MAEEYPSNSNRAKNDKPAAPEKKVEAVVSGGAKTRKKSEAKKLADTFISEDASNVKNYILGDVLIPATALRAWSTADGCCLRPNPSTTNI